MDFFFYGKVIDMFYFFHESYSFPVFNLADSYIFLGIVILFIQSIGKKASTIEKKLSL